MAACKATLLEAVFFFTKKYDADLCTKNLNWVVRQVEGWGTCFFCMSCFFSPFPRPKLYWFSFHLCFMKLHQSSSCTAGAVFGDDLDCSVDSRTINSTAPPCSGRSSMAATLPLSCFTLEDSLKLLHAKRTQKHLFCQQRRCLTLGSGFHQVIVRLKILAYCSQNNYHPFPPVPYTSPQPS